MRILKTYVPFGFNNDDSVRTIPCRSINVNGGLTFLVFFGILVRLDTDLGQIFSDMAYIFLCFLYCFFPIINLLFHVTYFYVICFTLYVLRFTFILYVSIVFTVCCKLWYCLLIDSSYLHHC